ncbi:hypothetical protein K458DRAFT_412702 [Lentithecium fluviatile CBS 122367]|uniref:Uncharacterized protein n=1 Tax=Lentithecium fluviatile CBS 122367 TaxID=1168545 RepID=A0A6G1JH17_9PLEO|nr:hypothetical protein K458DRAFT_412702 [Lentithecium fluviatile CBS 122367]
MAAHHDSNDDDPAAAASDALSLHTIADEADAYAAHEQEDADFALALALEDEETQRLVRAQSQALNQSESHQERRSEDQTEPFPPYRDDPDAEQQLEDGPDTQPPPYRDDPNAVLEDGDDENLDAELATTPSRRRNFVRILRKAGKMWLWCLGFTTGITLVIIGVVFILIWKFGKQDPKEAAWKSSHSSDYDLKIPMLYPALESGASGDCKTSWEKHASSLACHRMILSPVWDDGNADEVNAASADPFAYSVPVCTEQCRRSIEKLADPLAESCHRRTDRFDLTNYGKDGKAYFDKRKMEEGPIQAAKALVERYDRFCARPPRGEPLSEWGTCAADLWMRWGVVDGKNEMNLNGLDIFLANTSERRTFPLVRETGSLTYIGGKRTYDVESSPRTVGPGKGETDCGYCTVDWLVRKMGSFEFGEILDPVSGEPLGLKDFYDRMSNALRRCNDGARGRGALRKVKWKWAKYGWLCHDGPCDKDRKITNEVKQALHGVRKENDWPLPWIQQCTETQNAPKNALGGLRDGLTSMPCSIWFNENVAIEQIVPHQHIVDRLCSDQCRNAVDRIQQQYGDQFPKGSGMTPLTRLFGAWEMARDQADKICLSQSSNSVVTKSTSFCAPGYAALGHPEWIFPNKIPSRPQILSIFSEAIDKLDKKLPRYAPPQKDNPESRKVLARAVGESLCNPCAGAIFIGESEKWKKTVNEYLDDRSVDGREYTRVAKKGWMVCARMFGLNLTPQLRRQLWEMTGLDRYD